MRGLTKKILLLLALTLDEFNNWQENLTSSSLRLKFSQYKKNSFEKTIRKMLKTQDIEKIVKDGQPVYRLTSRGKTKLIHDVPLAKRIGTPWDGKWRMVIFDIPEVSKIKRDSLRRKLKELGFAKWQKSVYISPFDIGRELAEYLFSVGLAEDAIVLEAKKIFIGDEKEMANKLFHLDDLNERYKELLEKYQNRKNKKGMGEEYLLILESDPYLPKELLPTPWWGSEVRKILFRS